MALLAVSKSFKRTPARIQQESRSFLPLHTSEVTDRGNVVTVIATTIVDAESSCHLRRQMALLQIEILSVGNSSDSIIKELVSKIPKYLLEEKDENGNTALHNAAAVGNKSAVETRIISHRSLLMGRNSDGDSPLHLAAAFGRRETVCFLLSEIINHRPKGTPASSGNSDCAGSIMEDPNRLLLDGESGIKLVHLLISADLLDVAMEVLKRYPSFVWAKSDKWKTPMETLAQKPDAFRIGTPLRVSDAIWYHYIQVAGAWQCEEEETADIGEESINHGRKSTSTMRYSIINDVISHHFFQKRLLYNMKLVNTHAIELLRFLISQVLDAGSPESLEILKSSTQAAVRSGIVEFVGEVLRSCPTAIMDFDERGLSLLHQAVLHRQLGVFELLTRKISPPPCGRLRKDEKGNNFLHLAAEIRPPAGNFFGRVAPAHMEYEFAWFKKAETLVSKSYRDERNNDGKTPREVFTEQHENLVGEARQYTKQMSSHCATIAVLIATIAFASCYTFPGGIDDKGSPNLSTNSRFRGFICTNAVALVASVVSLVMFLKALTCPACHIEESFLTLRKIEIQGVLWLLVAVGGVLLTFAASLSLIISKFEGASGLTWFQISPYVLCAIPIYFGLILTNVEIYSIGRYKVEKKK